MRNKIDLRNLAGMVLATLALLAGFTGTAEAQQASPPTPATAANTVANIRDNVRTVVARLGSVSNAVDAINREGRPCPVGTWTIPIRFGRGVTINACTNRQPCDAERRAIAGRYEALYSSIASLRIRTTNMENVQRRLLQCNDQASCLQAADDMRDEIEASGAVATQALGNTLQIGGWIAQRLLPYLGEMSTAYSGLRTDVDDLKRRTSDLETWRTEVRPQIEEALRLGRENAAAFATARRRRLTVGIDAGYLRLAGPIPGPAWNAGGATITVMGRPLDSPVVVAGRLTLAYGETEGSNSRGAFGFFLQALGGYEWAGGRIMAGAVAGMLVSSRWRETIFLMGIGPMARVEFNPHRSVAIGAFIGGVFGNAIDPDKGRSHDTSRYMLGVDLGFQLGNW